MKDLSDMLVIRVELHSAITGQVKEIARMTIANTRKNEDHPEKGDYVGKIYKSPKFQAVIRRGEVFNHSRLYYSVWTLVGKMLKDMGYIK